MYYYRILSNEFAGLLEKGGELRWLFDFVLKHEELDFQIGRSKSKQWISVYYGLTKLFSIRKFKDSVIFIDTAEAYQNLSGNLYGRKNITANFQDEIEMLIVQIENESKSDRYYKNKKERYYQNILSRRYGICGKPDDDFVIIDKEVVIGYENKTEKAYISGYIQQRYKELQSEVSNQDPQRYGKDFEKEPVGNELDLLALDREGNLLIMEFKDATNTSGIYISLLQLGMYIDLFSALPGQQLESTVFEMLDQKQKIGLINPMWYKPVSLKDIIPVLIISNYSDKSVLKINFNRILDILKEKHYSGFLNNLKVLTFTEGIGLSAW